MKKSTCFGYTYDAKWEKYFPITAVKSDKHAYYCVPCGRRISCAYNGLHGLKKHCKTSRHSLMVAEDKSKTKYTESVCNGTPGTPQSEFSTSVAESTPGDLTATDASSTKFNRRSLAFQNGVNYSVSENQPKRLETSNNENKELGGTNMDCDSNIMELVDKCRYKYGLEFDMESDKEFHLGMGENFKLIVNGIYEELLFLRSVLKKLKHLKK
ncbi:hypothetical protein RF11_10988 [Thelohanellus kitauei]|uniref:Uncharacterized protein n=1 Tax=Thelohanellus kitauei TaxID=669202 RepID=A0A0C2M1W8_THEKT|nr:hypothetical protein RF11_10988 [Thelohanellus kitauei]